MKDCVIACTWSADNDKERTLEPKLVLDFLAYSSPCLCTVLLPLDSPQPAISHMVPGGTTYCSGGRQIRAT